MRRTRLLVRTAVMIGALALAFPSAARAGSITLTTDFVGLNVHYEFNGQLSEPVALGSVTMANGSGLNDTLNAPAQFEAYCADILTSVLDTFNGQPDINQPYDATASVMSAWADPNGLPSPTDGRLQAAYLYNKYVDPISPDAFVGSDQEGRTALQLAIWNVLYEDDFSVATTGGGNFHVSLKYTDFTDPLHPVVRTLDPSNALQAAQIASYEAIAARAQGFLDDVKLADVSGSDAAWIKLSVPGETLDAQDFIGPANTVPEPGSLLLLGTGLAALTAFRSRRLQRRS